MDLDLEYEIVEWNNPDGSFADGESANNDRMSIFTQEEMGKFQEFFTNVKNSGILNSTSYHWKEDTKTLYIVRHADIEKYREEVENSQVPKKTSREEWQNSSWVYMGSTVQSEPPTF